MRQKSLPVPATLGVMSPVPFWVSEWTKRRENPYG